MLSEDMIESISWYTGGNFDKLNENLRKGIPLTNTQKYHLQNIDNAFSLQSVLINSIVVFKGKTTSSVYSDKAPISTSTSYEAAKGFAKGECCVLKITVSAGSKVINIKGFSRYEDESEILLERDGNLEVTGEYFNEDDGMKIMLVTYTPPGSIKIETPRDGIKAEKIMHEKHIFDSVLSSVNEDINDGLIENEEDLENSVAIYYRNLTGKDVSKKFFEKIKELTLI